MEIKEIPTPTMPDWLKLYNTYDPEYYTPGKRVSAEEWNTLFLASVRQGNYNADTLELLIKTYLPETYLTQVDFNQFSNEIRTSYSTFTNNIQEDLAKHKTQVQEQYDTFTTQVQEDFTALTSEVNSLEERVVKAEDVAYSLNDVIQEANEYAQLANQTAIEANTFAQDANDSANTALETANNAAGIAASSNNTAQDALSTAQSAVTTANNAATQATQAVNTANAASLRAEDAIATANAAKTESAAAKNTAAQAETTANASNTTAESANDTASEAKRIAQNALDLVTEGQGSQVIVNGVAVDTFNADTKADLDYVDRQIAALIGAAPETLDTLEEVAKAIEENETVVDALNAAIGTKANKTDLDNYLPLSGGTMTGRISFAAGNVALPETDDLQFITGIESYAAGGGVTYTNRDNFKQKLLQTNGAIIKGRVYGSGDDEGLIIEKADNGCAGLCLGSSTGTRSVFYLKSDNSATWKWSNGNSSYDISHPQKAGTIALTSDIPTSLDSYTTFSSASLNNESSFIFKDYVTGLYKRSNFQNFIDSFNVALTSDISIQNFTTYTVIDATALDENTWYPVTFDASRKNLKIMLFNQWNGGTPSWATHSTKNYGCVKIWETTGHGWGELGTYRRVHLSVFSYTSTDPVRGVGQLVNSSTEYVYVRGGGKYNFYTSHNVVPVLRTSTYTMFSQSIAPTTTAPAEIVQTIMSTNTDQTISGSKTFTSDIALTKTTPLINITNTGTSGDTSIRCTRSDTGNSCYFGIGSGGVNRGFYDLTQNRWIMYCDGSKSVLNSATVPSGQTLTIAGTLIV